MHTVYGLTGFICRHMYEYRRNGSEKCDQNAKPVPVSSQYVYLTRYTYTIHTHAHRATSRNSHIHVRIYNTRIYTQRLTNCYTMRYVRVVHKCVSGRANINLWRTISEQIHIFTHFVLSFSCVRWITHTHAHRTQTRPHVHNVKAEKNFRKIENIRCGNSCVKRIYGHDLCRCLSLKQKKQINLHSNICVVFFLDYILRSRGRSVAL